MPKHINRRTVLKGLGAAVALPFLESMAPRAALAAGGKPPVRMAFLYIPNGVNYDEWKMEGEGRLNKFSKTLEGLRPIKDDVTVLSGLAHDKARANGDGGGDHARSSAAFLTGAQPKKHTSDIRAGISVDQLAAKKIGNQTRLPSLELGLEPGRLSGGCDSGYGCVYSSTISWRGPTSPMIKEINPRQVFQRLFGDPNQAENGPV